MLRLNNNTAINNSCRSSTNKKPPKSRGNKITKIRQTRHSTLQRAQIHCEHCEVEVGIALHADYEWQWRGWGEAGQ